MKRKIFIAALASLLLVFNWGCEDYLDVNHDPNVLEAIPDAKVLLPSAEIGLANQLMGWDFGFGGAYWVQYWTQSYTASQFKALCEYQDASFGSAYGELTAGVLADLNKIKKLTADKEEARGIYFVAEALSIYTWQVITDVWGNVPYFEALRGDENISSPKFDTGDVIYADLQDRIDALLALDMSGATLDSKFDFIYAGNIANWIRFANSLKLKLMIRQSETSNYSNAAALAFIQSADLLVSSAKIDGSVWSDTQEGKRHPMREFQEGGANYLSTNVIACKSFVDYLATNVDPRLSVYFTQNTSGEFQGAFFGDFDSKENSDGAGATDDKESYSKAAFAGDQDIMIMSDWEVNFYIAEVYARASDPEAKTYYDLGVQASLVQNGISDFSIINAGGKAEWQNLTVEGNIKQIAMQKWVANAYYQHIESFLERNRTKYPSVNPMDIKLDRENAFRNFPIGQLTVSVNGRAKLNGNLPASPIYPEAVLTRNENAPGQKINVGEKVWWNKKAGL
ncbi:MAG: SusD/RagB family nutrient-binding outer membrane lipoprotein [Bacteroidales bacterium]|nr:SusD/RagB family nutrient-binding outer membrane lipoprotein [Bacteroidales bacterium]MBN2748543.1 SusD/RagB family nutrient-binding outer membrane lipoprotein [Bacteroidales bacterium]